MQFNNNISRLNKFILSEVISKKEQALPLGRQKIQQKHFLKFISNINSLSDGQAEISFKDNFQKFTVVIKPTDGLYKGGRFMFLFSIPNKYPIVSPHITCCTPIYHPNIDDEGQICMSLLEDWDSSVHDLTDCLQGLLFLFYHPNLNDALSPFITSDMSYGEFEKNVYLSLRGCVIDGFYFPPQIKN